MPDRHAAPPPRRLIPVALLAVTFALAACDRTTPSEAAARPTGRARPTADLTPLPADGAPGAAAPALALEAAWNVGDAAGVAAQYTDDIEIINPIGVVLTGHAAALAAHQFLFSGPFKGSHRATEVTRVAYLTGTIAVVDLTSRLTGFVGLPPGAQPTQPGLVVSRERQVVIKRGGEWRIYMVQVTPVPPAP